MIAPASPLWSGITIERTLKFAREAKGRKVVAEKDLPVATPGKVSRIAKLMALAIHFNELVRTGKVRDYAELARLGGVSRARITQIMGLLNLSPKIQEELLFLPALDSGRDGLTLNRLRNSIGEIDWVQQSLPRRTPPRIPEQMR